MASHWVVGRAGVPCLDRAKGSAKPKSRFALTAAGRQTRVIGLARPGTAGQGAVRPREPLKCRGAPFLRLDSAGLAPIFAAMSVMREPRRRLDAEQSLPSFDPCLPRSADQPPAGPGWIHEIKHDGFRILAHRRGRSTRLVTRNGHDLADRFPLVTEATFSLSPALLAGAALAKAKMPGGCASVLRTVHRILSVGLSRPAARRYPLRKSRCDHSPGLSSR
jgi:hypothetical protein